MDLTASGLEEYTEYYYYVTVSDSHADPVQSETQGSVRTMCSGANLTCNGPFVEYEDCSNCHGKGKIAYVTTQPAGQDDRSLSCLNCGKNTVTTHTVYCDVCNPTHGQDGSFTYRECHSCGWNNLNELLNAYGHFHTTCTKCDGTGKNKEGTPIECEHGESSTHTYCIHGLMEPHEDLTELWQYLERVSKDIATRTDITINNDTDRVSGTTEKGETYNIAVGDTFKVRYDDEKMLLTVRVLGFKHDDLVEQNIYGERVQKAGISFEFVDFLDTTIGKMNSSGTSSYGWAATEMRKSLNGFTSNNPTQTGTIGGYAAKLSNANQIKKVKKDYLPDCDTSELSSIPAEDFLWLLSCGEIWSDGASGEGTRGYAMNSEGIQYKYYKTQTNGIAWNSANTKLLKKVRNNVYYGWWWLRSPRSSMENYFCCVHNSGNCNYSFAAENCGVAPGFCI